MRETQTLLLKACLKLGDDRTRQRRHASDRSLDSPAAQISGRLWGTGAWLGWKAEDLQPIVDAASSTVNAFGTLGVDPFTPSVPILNTPQGGEGANGGAAKSNAACGHQNDNEHLWQNADAKPARSQQQSCRDCLRPEIVVRRLEPKSRIGR